MKTTLGHRIEKDAKADANTEHKEIKSEGFKDASIRPIKNGFIVRKSYKRDDGSYFDEETFHDKNPLE